MSLFVLRRASNAYCSKALFSTSPLLPPSPPQTFRVLGLQQIAIGGLDKQALHAFWGTLLGIKKTGTGTGAIELDLMQPLDPEKAPKVHIPALNHIGLWVDNIHNAVKELTDKGVRFAPGGIRRGASGYDVAFVHPKAATGVLLELVQAPHDVIKASK